MKYKELYKDLEHPEKWIKEHASFDSSFIKVTHKETGYRFWPGHALISFHSDNNILNATTLRFIWNYVSRAEARFLKRYENYEKTLAELDKDL